MIQKIKRSEILENPIIRFSIGSLQRNLEIHRFEEAVTDKEVEEWQAYFEQVSDVEGFDETWQDKYAQEFILEIKETKLTNFLNVFPKKIESLFANFKIQKLYFLLEIKEDWFSQNKEDKQIKTILEKLSQITQNTSYNEGFVIDLQDLPQFFDIIFWIARQSLEMPPIWFGTKKDLWIAHICEYGNLHMHFYSEKEARNYQKTSQKLGLRLISYQDEKLRF